MGKENIASAFLLIVFPQIVFYLESYNLAVAKEARALCEIETIVISRLIRVARLAPSWIRNNKGVRSRFASIRKTTKKVLVSRRRESMLKLIDWQ